MIRYYTILCEDLQAYVFLHRALVQSGANGRNIYKQPFPDARGSNHRTVDGYLVYACGSQHVRMNFPQALAKLRVQNAKRRAALVVHIDVDNESADGRTVGDRVRELNDACRSVNVPDRRQDDPVALMIPRRNIETWIHFFLSGPPVNEWLEYPRLRGHEADCQPAAEAFADHARARIQPPDAPASLIVGLEEFARVL